MDRLALLAGVAVAVVTSSLSGQVVTLEFIAHGNMWQTDISETGSMVYARNEGSLTRLFRYTDGIGEEMLDIGDRDYVWRSKINSAGQVIFHGAVDDTTPAALRYTDGVGVEILSPPDAMWAYAQAINDAGQVTGSVGISSAGSGAFRYTDGLGLQLLDLGPDEFSTARGKAINMSGTVAGTADPRYSSDQIAFRYSDSEGVKFLGDLGGTMSVEGMNNHGDVIGFGELPDDLGYHFYIYTDEEGLTDIGGDGFLWEVQDINDDRWIAGWDFDNNDALLWTPEEGWLRLDSLLPPWLDADLNTAMGINNAGQIVGNGTINGEFGIYRMTIHSIPAPLTLAPLVLVGFGWNGRRAR